MRAEDSDHFNTLEGSYLTRMNNTFNVPIFFDSTCKVTSFVFLKAPDGSIPQEAIPFQIDPREGHATSLCPSPWPSAFEVSLEKDIRHEDGSRMTYDCLRKTCIVLTRYRDRCSRPSIATWSKLFLRERR